MLTIYKNKNDIPETMPYVELNDLFFNQNTVLVLDERAGVLIEQIDGSKMLSRFKIESKFNGSILNIDCLSTGCKTVLNVLYFPQTVFCLKECGENALEHLYRLNQGAVFCDYAVLPFCMNPVNAVYNGKSRIIEDYETLKEWWSNEK